MRQLKVFGFVAIAWLGLGCAAAWAEPATPPEEIVASDYEWWSKARFGVFMHWGPSSLLELPNGSWRRIGSDKRKGRNMRLDTPPESITSGDYKKYLEQPSRNRKVPMEVYDNLYHVFNPVDFNADEWVKTFADMGAGYIVFTTKHHDGFCMFDSKFTEYDIMSTPFGRDVAKELAEACRKYGLKVIWYYSKADWFDPSYDSDNPGPYQEYLMNQIEELCTNYGDVAGFWWDGGDISIETKPLFQMIRKYHPTAISNGRIQSAGQRVPGLIFSTPEQRLGSFNMDTPWESCVTIYPHDSWFWNGGHGCRTMTFALKVLVNCAMGDGNLLLDFGPSDTGAISPEVKALFADMADWTKAYGESIFDTGGGPYKPGVWGGSTRRGNKIYLHVMQECPGGKFDLPALPAKMVDFKVLTGGQVAVKQTADALKIAMDKTAFDPIDTVICLTVEGDSMDIKPIETMPVDTLTVDAEVTASSFFNAVQRPESVVLHSWDAKGKFAAAYGEEGGSKGKKSKVEVPAESKNVAKKELDNRRRFWEAKAGDQEPWLQLKLTEPKTFDRLTIRENAGTTRRFVVEYKQKGKWVTLYEGTEMELFALQLEKPVTAQVIRIRFLEFTDPPGVHVVHLYAPDSD